MANVYEIVTDKITAALRGGIVPWRRPWTGGESSIPRNAITNRPYHGVNVWLLTLSGYTDPRFLTFNQARERGTSIRKGEHGQLVVYWNIYEKRVRNADGEWETKSTAILRYYTVFHFSQVEDVDALRLKFADTTEAQWNATDEAERIIAGYDGPTIVHEGQDRAYYRPSTDTITVPLRAQFTGGDGYYATLFHELTHSTGTEKRLNRYGAIDHFGSPAYSREELVAEFGSAFLCAQAGIDNTLDNAAAYIAGWLAALSNDSKLLVSAAAQGQKAASFILGEIAEENGEEEQAA